MVEGTGTRLAKIEGDLARMETEFREDKAQRQIFQEKVESQLAQLMELMANQKNSSENPTSNTDGSHHRVKGTDSGHPIGGQNHVSHRDFKHDLPTFDGQNVDDWLFRLEEFFDLTATPMEQRIKIASFSMVGPAYSWYKWLVRNHYTQDWFVFVDAV